MGVSAFYLLYNVFVFLRKGTTGLTAQAYGAQDFVEVRASFVRPFVFAVVLGLAIATFHEPIMRAIFLWIEPPDEGTRAAASAYVAARVLGAPFALANYAVQGWLNGMQRASNVLVQNLILNASNAILCVYLALDLGGFGFALGVVGIGYAAALANFIAMVAGLANIASCVYGWNGQRRMAGHWQWDVLYDASRLGDFFSLGSTITIRSLLLTLMQTYFTGMAAGFGSTTLAADQLLLQFQSLVSSGTDGFANAAEALVGESVGQKDVARLVAVVKRSLVWAAVVAICFSATWAFGGPAILALMTDQLAVRRESDAYLFWVVVGPFVSVWSYLFDGFFVGATLAREMMISMIFATATFVVSVYTFVEVLGLGNNGLWLSFYLWMATRAVALAIQRRRVVDAATPKVLQNGPLLTTVPMYERVFASEQSAFHGVSDGIAPQSKHYGTA